MLSRILPARQFFWIGGPIALATACVLAQPRQKLPRPTRLDSRVRLARDPATGEMDLRAVKRHSRDPNQPRIAANSQSRPATIRVRVNLVELGCEAFARDGGALRGLHRQDFRVFEDGVEQSLAYFDASTEPASIALVIDASPSVLRDSTEMKQAALALTGKLAPSDEVAVVDFSEHTYLLLPFSRDRERLERIIGGVDVRKLFPDTGGSNIYRSTYLVAKELFRGRTGRKAIVLLTDGQDNGLGLNLDGAGVRPAAGDPPERLTFEDVASALASQAIELYAISTENRPKVMTEAWLAAHERQTLVTPAVLAIGIPAYTAFLAELVRLAGGQLYFLRETGSLADAYASVAQTLSEQYTLSFYPSAGRDRPGWHSLRVEVLNHGPVRAVHRIAYYAPPGS